MKSTINYYNKNILEGESKTDNMFNWSTKLNCLLNYKFLIKGTYKAIVRNSELISSTGHSFKKKKSHSTSISILCKSQVTAQLNSLYKKDKVFWNLIAYSTQIQ